MVKRAGRHACKSKYSNQITIKLGGGFKGRSAGGLRQVESGIGINPTNSTISSNAGVL